MHPAYSVIVFTTLSGAGYGLLICLAAVAFLGVIPPVPSVGLIGFGVAFTLIAAGLLSSTLHLGRPARAWRAFSQWRTSWLSREGILAVATFIPAGILAAGWVLFGTTSGVFTLAALASIVLALATVYSTGMIYQSLPTIRAWHRPIVAPIYCVFALATGSVLAVAVFHSAAIEVPAHTKITVALLVLAAALKRGYWKSIDSAGRTYSSGQATGLGTFGDVRPLDPPHTQPNYVMREMGYAIGRKHAEKLRWIAIVAGAITPAAALMLLPFAPPVVGGFLAAVAVVTCAVGVFAERWLFFAEAQHVVTLYYGAATA